MVVRMKATTFGARIRELREAANLSPTQLGAAMGVSESAVRKWESDTSTPRDPMLPDLAKTLGVTVRELVA